MVEQQTQPSVEELIRSLQELRVEPSLTRKDNAEHGRKMWVVVVSPCRDAVNHPKAMSVAIEYAQQHLGMPKPGVLRNQVRGEMPLAKLLRDRAAGAKPGEPQKMSGDEYLATVRAGAWNSDQADDRGPGAGMWAKEIPVVDD